MKSQSSMRILYTETTEFAPASAHFLEAFESLAASGRIDFEFLDEAKFVSSQLPLIDRVARRIVGRPLRGYREINRALLETAQNMHPDIILIGKGAYFEPATLRDLKASTGALLINYAADDVFNFASSSRAIRDSIPQFDLYLCARRAMLHDIERAGCPRAEYIMFGYKPQVHFPELPATAAEHRTFDSDVVFIGGCDADRAPYFEHLVRALPDVRVHLHGAYFERYPALKPYARGKVTGRDYRLALGGSKVAINLVRRANRDDHVMRTFEVPACGAFMLTERTPTHESLFVEDREAVFFDSAEELVAKVRHYLEHHDDRGRIAAAGLRRILAGHHSYADRTEEILNLAASILSRDRRVVARRAV